MYVFNGRTSIHLQVSDSLLFVKHMREPDIHLVLPLLIDHLYIYQFKPATRLVVPSYTG